MSLDVDFTAEGHPDLDVEVTSNLIGTAFGGDYTATDGKTGTVGMTKRNIPGE